MPRDARAYLADILDSCDAISAALSGLDLEAYKANRLVRSSVEREFTITGERTVASTEAGHDELLAWARGLDPARIFAIEDCRHVSGRAERSPLAAGERVVRVPPKLMAGAHASARTYGRSDGIDVACVVRAALRALPQSTRCRIALDELARCRESTLAIRSFEREIRTPTRVVAPEPLAFPGCSVIGAAHLVGEMAGVSRFTSESAFAMHARIAPSPVSSGKSEHHRLNRAGNRKLSSTIHMIAVTRARMHPPAIAYMDRKRSEGMSNREALRCIKRHISRALFKTMLRAEKARTSGVVRVDFIPGPVAVAV